MMRAGDLATRPDCPCSKHTIWGSIIGKLTLGRARRGLAGRARLCQLRGYNPQVIRIHPSCTLGSMLWICILAVMFWITPQRPRANARISRGAVRTVKVSPCEEIRCAILARVAEGRHHHSSASGEGMALHRCWHPYPRGTAFHLVRSTTHDQS